MASISQCGIYTAPTSWSGIYTAPTSRGGIHNIRHLPAMAAYIRCLPIGAAYIRHIPAGAAYIRQTAHTSRGGIYTQTTPTSRGGIYAERMYQQEQHINGTTQPGRHTFGIYQPGGIYTAPTSRDDIYNLGWSDFAFFVYNAGEVLLKSCFLTH